MHGGAAVGSTGMAHPAPRRDAMPRLPWRLALPGAPAGLAAIRWSLIGLTGLVALAALGSHVIDRDLLSIFPEPTPIKGNTSLAAVLVVAALALDGRRAARLMGAGVLAIGVLTFAQYVLGTDLGIDLLLFDEFSPPLEAGPYPGRMAPNSALALALLGGAILARSRAALLLAVASFLIGMGGVIGHADNTTALAQVGRNVVMALPTALVLLLASGALILTRESAWFTRDTVGGTLVRRLGVGALLLPMIIGTFLLAGIRSGLFSPTVGVVAVHAGRAWSSRSARSSWWRARSTSSRPRRPGRSRCRR